MGVEPGNEARRGQYWEWSLGTRPGEEGNTRNGALE